MIFILAIFLLLLFVKAKYRHLDEVDDYLSKDYTTCISGVFAVLVLFGHFGDYIDIPSLNIFDSISINLTSGLGQLVVVPFLFFSGYGLLEQIKSRGDKYVKSLPKNRILRLYLMFLFAWLLFLIVSLSMQKPYNPAHYAWSVIGFTSIGNSNWYVVVILALYTSTFLSYLIFKDQRVALISNIILIVGLYVVLMVWGMPHHWYDTVLGYATGLAYSFFKDKILLFYKKVKGGRLILLLASIALTGGFGVLNIYFPHDVFFAMMVISFANIFPALLALFKIRNKFYLIVGQYTFWIYILQRIPMIIFHEVPEISGIIHLYLFIVMAVTAVLAFAVDKAFNFTWSILNPKKSK